MNLRRQVKSLLAVSLLLSTNLKVSMAQTSTVSSLIPEIQKQISEIERQSIFDMEDGDRRKIQPSEYMKNPKAYSNVTILTREFQEISPGFRMRIHQKHENGKIALKVTDDQSHKVLARTIFDFNAYRNMSPVEIRVSFDSSISFLKTQLINSLQQRSKVSGKDSNFRSGKFAALHNILFPKAHADDTSALEFIAQAVLAGTGIYVFGFLLIGVLPDWLSEGAEEGIESLKILVRHVWKAAVLSLAVGLLATSCAYISSSGRR